MLSGTPFADLGSPRGLGTLALPALHRRGMRLHPDPVMAAWVELLDELESGGPLMREVVHDSLEIYGEQRMRSPVGGAHLRG